MCSYFRTNPSPNLHVCWSNPNLSPKVKMLAEVKDMPSVKEMLSTAQKILGIWDLLKFLTTGLVSHGDNYEG